MVLSCSYAHHYCVQWVIKLKKLVGEQENDRNLRRHCLGRKGPEVRGKRVRGRHNQSILYTCMEFLKNK